MFSCSVHILAIHHPGFLRVKLQPYFAQPCIQMLTHLVCLVLAHAVQDSVISVATERNARMVRGQPVIQCVVQKQIRKDGGQRTALRRTHRSRTLRPIHTLHWSCQPAFHQKQHPSIIAMMTKCFQEKIVINVIEQAANVILQQPVAFPATLARDCDRVMC